MPRNTLEITPKTNARVAILRGQLALNDVQIKNSDVFVNYLLDEHYELEKLKRELKK
jgi:CRISPR/Cas system-associated protein endoribonuclease Cas2